MSLERPQRIGTWITAAVANLIVAAPLAWALVSQARSASLYAASMQEDGALEWMTAWGFIYAGALFAYGAHRESRRRIPWFSIGLALFCLIVALEEISWGQRLIGYRPPIYFLEHNYQQELNVHNLVDTSLRKLALKAIIVGYGVALPLLARLPRIRQLLGRLGLWAPPAALVPGFALAAVVYQTYPWKFSGELVESMLAIAFLFAALSCPDLGPPGSHPATTRLPRSRTLLTGVVTVAVLGIASGAYSARARQSHPGNIDAAHAETEALKRDLLFLTEAASGEPATHCGLHRRVYTWTTRDAIEHLFGGQFAGLTLQGLPTERADYFLDPWNSPYWVRHRCSSSRQRVVIYSFGPNRQRDSTGWEILGDDIGAVIDIPPPADP